MRPLSCFQLSRTPWSFFTAPLSPENLLVFTLQSRCTPSSCELEVRMIIGQSGHGISAVRFSGGIGNSSN